MLTGLCLLSKLRKCTKYSEDLSFGRHEGKLETFAKICVAASLDTLRKDPTIRVCDKQAAWKLLSEISRTAPCVCMYACRVLLKSSIFILSSLPLTKKNQPSKIKQKTLKLHLGSLYNSTYLTTFIGDHGSVHALLHIKL